MNALKKKDAAIGEENRVKTFLINNAIYIVLLAIIVVIILIDPKFLSFRNLRFIVTQASPRIIIALGVAGIIVLGGTDLSAGKAVGMSAIICASLLQSITYNLRIYKEMGELPLIVPLLLAMAVCAAFSALHGVMVAKLRIAPFIASLGMQMIIYGVQSVYFDKINDSSPIGGLDPRYTAFAQGSFNLFGATIPYLAIFALVITVVMWVIWNKTTLGKNMFAIGGNPEAATISGVNNARTMVIIYSIAGLLYGFAGFLEAARTGSATNNLGQGYELDAIAACVVGGVSMRGGIGKISGILVGVFIFQVINYGLVFISVNPYVQYIIKGLIILFAITVDTQKYVKKK